MRWVRRVLVVLLVLPLLAVLGLLLAGQREDAGRNVERVVIGRPPAQVFRHLVQGDLIRQWTRLAVVESLTAGDLRQGSRLKLVADARGERTPLEAEVTALEKNRLVTLAIRTPPGSPVTFTQRAEYRLEDRAGSTRLSVITDARYDALIARLFEPLITRAAQKQLEANLARLRTQVESEPARD